jgi:hypothetical protein
VSFSVSPLQTGPLLPATGGVIPMQFPHNSHHDPFLKKLKHLLVILKISSASAGFAMAFLCASVIRGTSIPLFVLLASQIAEESAAAPLLLTATPPCAKICPAVTNISAANSSMVLVIFINKKFNDKFYVILMFKCMNYCESYGKE